MEIRQDLRAVASAFRIPGEWVGARPHGEGHIHATFLSTFRLGGAEVRYIHQRINRSVFPDPDSLMENIAIVTARLDAACKRWQPPVLRPIEVIPTRSGGPIHRDAIGEAWRTYGFVEGARSYHAPLTPREAGEAARAYALFQKALLATDGYELHVTIPRFHDLKHRLDQFEDAARRDVAGRAAAAREEIAFVRRRAPMGEGLGRILESRGIPVRATHNDAKMDNVLLSEETGLAVCVIDLDTVMPGTVLYDFGDMVRSMTCPAREDASDASRIGVDLAFFEAMAEGYLSVARRFLAPEEASSLVFGGLAMTFMVGVRFLTDHLSGDVYFGASREGQNLDRCRVQFRILESLERNRIRMEQMVDRIAVPI